MVQWDAMYCGELGYWEEFGCTDTIDALGLCESCKLSDNRVEESKHIDKTSLMKYRLCQLCEDKLSARLLQRRGGGLCLWNRMAPMIQQWKVNIECHKKFPSYHRYYCKSCFDHCQGKDHISLSTDEELFAHLNAHYGIQVKYILNRTFSKDHNGDLQKTISIFYVWRQFPADPFSISL